MIQPREQRTAVAMAAAFFLPGAAAFFACLFATGHPDAVPLLCLVAGLAAGALVVGLAARLFGRGESPAGRWARAGALACACVAGFWAYAALPPGNAPFVAVFSAGVGLGAGLTAFSGLLLGLLPPPDLSARGDRV